MARVTVGIPVYNGETMLEECLDCVLGQTFEDIKVVISDNASTDGSAEIYEAYAKKDSRVTFYRHPENQGPLPNFKYLVDQCDTEFYMWRADDDYSDPNYIETLVALHDQSKTSQLAVGSVVTRYAEESYTDVFRYEEMTDPSYAKRICERMYRYHASWYYGLWRTDYIQKTSSRVWTSYPEAYAGDHLTLLSPILDEVIVGTNETLFTQRTYSPVKGDGMRGKRSIADRITMLERLMPIFYECYDEEVKARELDAADEKAILAQRKDFTYDKLRATPFRIFRLKLKKALGKKY